MTSLNPAAFVAFILLNSCLIAFLVICISKYFLRLIFVVGSVNEIVSYRNKLLLAILNMINRLLGNKICFLLKEFSILILMSNSDCKHSCNCQNTYGNCPIANS